jgi:hypothetical protein
MCPIQWQDQYNMNKMGMMLIDMAYAPTRRQIRIFREVFQEGRDEKGKKCPGTNSTARVPTKVCFEKNYDLCMKHGGTYTMPNTCDCCRFEKDGKEKSNFCAAKKGGKKGNSVNHNFAQLTKKIEKLEKVLKKSGKKGQKRHHEDSDSNCE